MEEFFWIALEIMQEHLQNLMSQGYMTTVELVTYHVPEGPTSPISMGGGYVVACAAFYERGFSVPSHQFLRSLLQFYDLKSCITLPPRGSYIWRPS
jgi:hypothetical protein